MKRLSRLFIAAVATFPAAVAWAGTYSIDSGTTTVDFQSVNLSGYSSQSYSCYMVPYCSHTFETDWQVTLFKVQRTILLSASASGTWFSAYTWGIKYTPSGSGDVPADHTAVFYQGRVNIQADGDLEAIDTYVDGSSVYDGSGEVTPQSSVAGTYYELGLSGVCRVAGSNGTNGSWVYGTLQQGAIGSWTLGSDGNYYATFGFSPETTDSQAGTITKFSGDTSKCIVNMGDQLSEQWTLTQVGSQAFTAWA